MNALEIPAGARALWERFAQRADRFGNGEWVALGFLGNALLLLLTQLFILLWPSPNAAPPEIAGTTDLSFVEFQEIRNREPVKTRDLSDKIIEKDKLDKKEEVNWQNAADPTFDLSQRYRPIFRVGFSDENYPSRARRSNLPTVTVNFTMLIGADGRIQDVRIRSMRSPGNAHKPFEKDFRKAVRQIIMQQTKLLTRPYSVGGSAQKFKWNYSIKFRLK